MDSGTNRKPDQAQKGTTGTNRKPDQAQKGTTSQTSGTYEYIYIYIEMSRIKAWRVGLGSLPFLKLGCQLVCSGQSSGCRGPIYEIYPRFLHIESQAKPFVQWHSVCEGCGCCDGRFLQVPSLQPHPRAGAVEAWVWDLGGSGLKGPGALGHARAVGAETTQGLEARLLEKQAVGPILRSKPTWPGCPKTLRSVRE